AHTSGTRERPNGAGPSPRAWGSPVPRCCYSALLRSIPTCVGLTPTWVKVGWSRAVHPHVRGAHPVHLRSAPGGDGPSPRAWGSRLTADALTDRDTVHPHVRGAHRAKR